jgi:hypothetical protein
MVETLKNKIFGFFFRKQINDLQKEINYETNRRVAEYISKMDPLEPLMKQQSVIFSDEFERVEDQLDANSKITMAMWAYGQKRDPCMKRMMDWVCNTVGNETIKRAPITAERTQYGRAQIANIVLLKKEIGRLSLIYEEKLVQMGGKNFDDENKLTDY